MKTTPRGGRRHGFSLIELLTVIAIIGIVAAIVIPNLGTVNQASQKAVNQRNAQSVVNMYHSGRAMGIVWNGADRNAKIDSVITGQSASGGIFAGQIARAPGITGTQLSGVYSYIGTDTGGDLVYDIGGTQSPN